MDEIPLCLCVAVTGLLYSAISGKFLVIIINLIMGNFI